jgi:hypothetical protein
MTDRFRTSLTLLSVLLCAATVGAQTLSVNGVHPPASAAVVAATAVELSVSGASGDASDWVGLYPVGAADGSYVTWSFLNGSQTAPASGVTAATIDTFGPLTAGQYEWRLY